MSNGQNYNPFVGGGQQAGLSPLSLGKTSPITTEVQQREEMEAANEAILAAARSDQARQQEILQQAQTGGRRQAAESMLQATRGVETGTGVGAAMGRQAAADALMQEQQLAAQRAAETPAFDIATLEKQALGEGQAMGTLQTDRQGKMTSYWEQINAFPDTTAGKADRDASIDAMIQNEFGTGDPDWWVINWLNGMRSEPNPAYNLPYGGTDAPIGTWYQDESGAWVMNQLTPEGGIETQTSAEKPAGAYETLGEWEEYTPWFWRKNVVGPDGTVTTEYHTGDAPPAEEGAEEEDDPSGAWTS